MPCSEGLEDHAAFLRPVPGPQDRLRGGFRGGRMFVFAFAYHLSREN